MVFQHFGFRARGKRRFSLVSILTVLVGCAPDATTLLPVELGAARQFAAPE